MTGSQTDLASEWRSLLPILRNSVWAKRDLARRLVQRRDRVRLNEQNQLLKLRVCRRLNKMHHLMVDA